jgi:hypothetical protein
MGKTAQKKAKTEESLSLVFDAESLTAEKFLKAVTSFLNLVREVSAEVAGSRTAVETIVAVHEGSVVIEAKPRLRPNARVSGKFEFEKSILDGIRQLERNPETIPAYYNPESLASANALSMLMSGKNRLTKLEIKGSTHKPASFTPQTSASVERLLGSKFSAHGSVEGTLRTITSENDDSIKFYVFDALNNTKIECLVSEEEEQKILSFFKRRVVVDGLVQYDRDGFPRSITAENVEPLPGFGQLPPVEKYRGMFVS